MFDVLAFFFKTTNAPVTTALGPVSPPAARQLSGAGNPSICSGRELAIFTQPVTAFVPVTAKADDFGFGVTATVTTNVIDMVELAKSSGAPVNVYSAMKFAIGIVMGMMSMYI